MKIAIRTLLLATAAVPSALSAQTASDTSSDKKANGDETIIVTGTRSAEPLPADRIGGSITVLDETALKRRQVRYISDVLRDVPGIAVGRVPGQTQIRIRGAEANHTLVLIDGIEVSDPFVGEFDFGGLIADDAARVEVLRGQQSAIYGSDAIGGVIHYITPTGREAPGISARIDGGSFATVNTAVRLAGVEGTIDYALSATLNSTDGRPGARVGTRDLANDTGALSLKANWRPSETFRLTGVVRYGRTEAEFNNSDNDFASPTFGFQIDTPDNEVENEAIYGLLRGELDLLDGDWTHRLTGQIVDTTRDGFSAEVRSYGSEGQRLKGSYETTMRFDGAGVQHRLTGAVDVERERFRNTDPSGFLFSGQRQINNVGFVAQYDALIGDNASFGASIRRDDNDRFADTTTYRLHGSYRFDTGTRLRAAAGSGVKNPGFYELFGLFDGRFIGNPDLQPERSEGWEVGVEQELAQGAATFGLTYFESDLEREIFTLYSTVATPANRDTISTQSGVEAFAQTRFGDAWTLNATYTYLRARENGGREIRRPAHTASFAVDWRAPADKGGVSLVARYNGESDDDAFIDPSYIPVRVQLDDYVLVNLNADVKVSGRIDLFGRVENLADADYEDVFSFETPGRSFYVGARARF